jgi:hypothetical protein
VVVDCAPMLVDMALGRTGGETCCAGTTGGESFPFASNLSGTTYRQLHYVSPTG